MAAPPDERKPRKVVLGTTPKRAAKGPMRKGLPDRFPTEKSFSLYEGIEYADYWSPDRARQDVLERHLVSAMLPAEGRRIIDIGCGYGRLAPCYVKGFDQVVLYDGSMTLLRQARKAVAEDTIVVAGDVGRLPFRRASFDAALCIRVLHHFHDLPGTLSEVRGILARDASFVFSYHNKRNANRILHLYRSAKVANPFSLESREVSPTIISRHPKRVRAALGQAGFADPEYRGAVVLKPVAALMEKLGGSKPSGLLWSRITGRFNLAPWLIGRARADGGEPLRKGRSRVDFLQCPSCGGHLTESSGDLACGSCAREYPCVDGILDFRL